MAILLISYIFFVLGFIIYSASGLYHLWRFGYVGDMTKPAIYIYVFASLSVIILSFIAISFRTWEMTF